MKKERFLELALEFDRDLYMMLISLELKDIVTSSEAYLAVESYLDYWCSNGYFSRWTHHGDALFATWERFDAYIKEVCE